MLAQFAGGEVEGTAAGGMTPEGPGNRTRCKMGSHGRGQWDSGTEGASAGCRSFLLVARLADRRLEHRDTDGWGAGWKGGARARARRGGDRARRAR